MRILFYAKSPDATEFYRVSIPAKYLSRIDGVEVKFGYAEKHAKVENSGIKFSEVEWADVVIFQRPATEIVYKLVEIIKKKNPNKKILLDYDDDYYSVPKWNPGYPFIKMNERWWPKFPSAVDGVIVSTEPLAEVYRSKTDKPVKVIPNGFDFEMFDNANPLDECMVQNPGYDKKTNKAFANYTLSLQEFNTVMEGKRLVTWAGSRFHYVDIDWIAEDVKKIVKEKNDVNFMFVSYLQANILKDVAPNRIYSTSGTSPVSRFYGLLKSFRSDVMLAPLDPCKFNSSKSNLKIMEIMALKSFPVCSDWCPYEGDLDPDLNEDETHGILVGYEKGDWYRAINLALEKTSDRSYVSAYQTVNDAYNRSTHDASLRSQLYIDFIKEIQGNG
jgi:glycosyltransferase involved in cell wall biosynthesis